MMEVMGFLLFLHKRMLIVIVYKYLNNKIFIVYWNLKKCVL